MVLNKCNLKSSVWSRSTVLLSNQCAINIYDIQSEELICYLEREAVSISNILLISYGIVKSTAHKSKHSLSPLLSVTVYQQTGDDHKTVSLLQ